MKVEWTDNALEQLWAIHDYITQSSPEYAQRVVDRLTARSQQIRDFPLSGRVVQEYNAPQIREVIEGPYRIIYYIRPDRIDVLAVIHGAQQTPWSR
ncbi:MAG: type II toxin-antitoxin system RelE/ParE family toxin [Desulfomonile tiedjei]|nr:type II toxin-antitoxin system RelE/ParE family toxin [Desulfomonile tiedjei]